MKVRSIALAVVVALAAAACRSAQPPLKLGARAIAVDLAFSDPKLAVPVPPEVIVQVIPAPPQVVSGGATLESVALPPQAMPSTQPSSCRAAPEGAAPVTVAPVGVKAPPTPGIYPRHNTGTFGISAGALNLKLPFPPTSTDELSAVREVAPATPLDVLGPAGEAPSQPGSGVYEWTVLHTITPTFTTKTTYRLTADAIEIVRQVTTSAAGEQVFEPSPPITLMALNQGVGASWRSAGVDKQRRTALSIEGRIESTQAVDLCGELVDSYRVVTKETFVNLATGETSGTNANESNVYNVATQYGGLLVRSELHYTQQTRDPGSGTPILISYDYTSTMDGRTPKP